MKLLLHIVTGIGKVIKYWDVVVLIAVVQLLLAWLMAAPLSAGFHQSWSMSTLPADLEGGHGLSGAMALDEVLFHSAGLGGSSYSTPVMLAFLAAYIIFSMFVLAGTLPLYSGLDLKFNWERFLSDGARFFRPFFGLALISLLFFFLADMLSSTIANVIQESLEGSNDEATRFISGLLFVSLFRFLLFSLVVLIFQFAKITGAVDQVRNVFYLMRRAFGFISRHFIKVMTIFLILLAVEFLILLLDKAVWYHLLPQSAFPFQVAWLIFSTILFVIIKLLFFAAQIQLYSETRRQENETSSVSSAGLQSSRYPDVI